MTRNPVQRPMQTLRILSFRMQTPLMQTHLTLALQMKIPPEAVMKIILTLRMKTLMQTLLKRAVIQIISRTATTVMSSLNLPITILNLDLPMTTPLFPVLSLSGSRRK